MLGVITPLPAIEGLRGDTEVTASETGILTVGVIIIKPFKPLPGSFR